MATPRVRGRRVEAGLVGLPGADGLGKAVVNFQDDALGAVVAVILLLVLAADDGEGEVDDDDQACTNQPRELGPEEVQAGQQASLSAMGATPSRRRSMIQAG